jgi:TonB family protein
VRRPGLIPLLALPLLATLVFAQQDVYRTGPGIKPPKVIRQRKPGYTQQAYYSRIQGKVVCEVIVDEHGKPANVSVLSPLGFGLDERALAAIRGWEFAPGTKDGQPVKVVTLVEVNFRFPGTWFDDKAEKRRSTFNVALVNLRRRDQSLAQQGLKSVEELARQKYLPAMHVLGRLRISGELGAKDPDQGLALIRAAAEKGHAPAMTDLGVMYFEGNYAPRDVEKGLQLLRDAAVYGSSDAQLFLGRHYEAGDAVPREPDRARRYFRLCAAAGQRACQFRLAKLMFEAPDRKEWEYLQAITWFQLAADRGVAEARRIVEAEMPKLTPEQAGWVRRLKTQLGRGRSFQP